MRQSRSSRIAGLHMARQAVALLLTIWTAEGAAPSDQHFIRAQATAVEQITHVHALAHGSAEGLKSFVILDTGRIVQPPLIKNVFGGLDPASSNDQQATVGPDQHEDASRQEATTWLVASGIVAFLGIASIVYLAPAMHVKNKSNELAEHLRVSHYPPVSLGALLLITSYRFYTGFLASTWLPFLIARESDRLASTHQGGYMGLCKCIYGVTAAMTPLLGLLSDRIGSTPVMGRSPFIIVGSLIGCTGVIWCKVASMRMEPYFFLFAIGVWMLGEAIADSTAETAVVDLVPPSQYDLAGSVRSFHFITGIGTGLVGLLVAPYVFTGYTWLYVSYFVLMIVCSMSTSVITIIIRHRRQHPAPLAQASEEPLPNAQETTAACCSSSSSSTGAPATTEANAPRTIAIIILEAYVAPLTYSGHYLQALLAFFVLSCGMAPMYLTLLAVRDLDGVTDPDSQQFYFGAVSLIFFVAAGASSVICTAVSVSMSNPADASASSVQAIAETTVEAPIPVKSMSEVPDPPVSEVKVPAVGAKPFKKDKRWLLLMISTLLYAAVCAFLPAVALPASLHHRLMLHCLLSIFLGISFGVAYANIQILTWIMIPEEAELGNALGFVSLTKVMGIGISSIMAGLVLDLFLTPDHKSTITGWAVMSWACVGLLVASAYIQYLVYLRGARDTSEIAGAQVLKTRRSESNSEPKHSEPKQKL